jgi:diaminohydroxyphosphoribosylaminopyrimidine deaminase / 5-amino-6-(5-phosphoribosylamino)uracil reductase
MENDLDIHFMRQALALARRGLGRTWPNPSVGCVIVKNDHVVGCGRTAESGRPHAEAAALQEAGADAKGATAYVSLEPCAVSGREGACAPALVRAGIKRAVIACMDTNPLVFGQGIEILKEAGVDVTFGVLEEDAQELNKGFFLRFSEERPLITLKTACSLDGKVALANGQSQWITGELARRHVHSLRVQHDAVLVGIGTVKADDPMLNARVDGLVHNTVRIILDSKLETPMESRQF